MSERALHLFDADTTADELIAALLEAIAEMDAEAEAEDEDEDEVVAFTDPNATWDATSD
jgi:hypothetical protein